ncbi:oligosaccharide flippase family protein [Marinifilum flexuosum]|uniref:oligosaccharide flippase family protein n=1 Tax=Marinifilum flexuosum TaxID=1117708 RepID=UPI00249356FC|nr:oligosaccharide flippase family protein [Marinifilum flexuosum]
MKSKFLKIIREKNIVSLSTSVITAALGLLGFLLLTRGLEKSLFGDWVLYTSLATFFDLLRFGLTSTALVRFASGGSVEQKKAYLGTSFKIGLYVVLGLAILLWILLFLTNFFEVRMNNGYHLFLKYYPILAILNLSWNNSVSFFQAKQNFKSILLIRLINVGAFVLFLIANNLFLHLSLLEILYAHLVCNLLPSILVFAKKWDGLLYIKRASKETLTEMLNFGKFSMGTLVGSSLLRSADTFIIGLSPVLGSVGIAQYAIPLKLTDLLGIPLRSFTVTAFPKMSKLSLDGKINEFKDVFYSYSGAVTFLFIPVAIGGFIFAEQLVWLLGGDQYKDSIPLLANIFRIFSIYSVLLPIDRFTGVALDSINLPKMNFYKVIVMTSANIIGDLIAVFVFQSLQAVAIVTVVFTLIGILIGYYYLNREIKVNVLKVVSGGLVFFRTIKRFL